MTSPKRPCLLGSFAIGPVVIAWEDEDGCVGLEEALFDVDVPLFVAAVACAGYVAYVEEEGGIGGEVFDLMGEDFGFVCVVGYVPYYVEYYFF